MALTVYQKTVWEELNKSNLPDIQKFLLGGLIPNFIWISVNTEPYLQIALEDAEYKIGGTLPSREVLLATDCSIRKRRLVRYGLSIFDFDFRSPRVLHHSWFTLGPPSGGFHYYYYQTQLGRKIKSKEQSVVLKELQNLTKTILKNYKIRKDTYR